MCVFQGRNFYIYVFKKHTFTVYVNFIAQTICVFFMLIALHPTTTENNVVNVHTDFPVFLHLDDLTFSSIIGGWELFAHKHSSELFAVSKN